MHFLGPNRPLASLSTWDEVASAAAGGLLGENPWCEPKEKLPPSNDKMNTELGKDLASLSVHGASSSSG